VLDGFGNALSGGGWEFDLISGNALAPFNPLSASSPDTLDTFVETASALAHYDYLEHVQSVTDGSGNTFGDYWQMQAIGATESLYPDQLNLSAASLAASIPEPSPLVLASTVVVLALAVGQWRRRRSLTVAAA
jgi:hypothetical protein